jgi:hypothetical protein
MMDCVTIALSYLKFTALLCNLVYMTEHIGRAMSTAHRRFTLLSTASSPLSHASIEFLSVKYRCEEPYCKIRRGFFEYHEHSSAERY